MKKKVLAYFSGVLATVLVLTMVTTALAASGKATFNFVNVSLRGEQKIAAGADITVANGQKVPSSILYTDEKGGKTNYLPIRAISELLGVEIKYDSATKTVQLEKQPTAVDAGALGQWSRSFEANMVGYTMSGCNTTQYIGCLPACVYNRYDNRHCQNAGISHIQDGHPFQPPSFL